MNTRDSAAERAICAALQENIHAEVYDMVGSTNDLLREAAEQGAETFTVIAARCQTAGRGRQGRAFFSPEHTGLYLSMLFRPDAADVPRLTPMAAAAAARTVEACRLAAENVQERAQIKWVNDVLLHGKKVCGILAESKFSSVDAPEYTIVGIGLNLLEPEGGFPAELRDIAGAIFPRGYDPDKAFVTAASHLIAALYTEQRQLSSRGYLQRYKERLCVLGREITVCENGTERPAVALAVDDDLRLLVRYADDGTEQWRATGEIRIRL